MIKAKLLDYLYCGHSFSDTEDELKYKFLFLKTIILIALIVTIFMTVNRYLDNNMTLVTIDAIFVVVLIFLLYCLKKSKKNFEIISHAALLSIFLLIGSIFTLLSSAIQKYTTTQCKSAPLCNTYLAEISNNPASRFCFNL